MHTCAHMHMHVCTHTCMLNMINMDASMSVAICNFYTCVTVVSIGAALAWGEITNDPMSSCHARCFQY